MKSIWKFFSKKKQVKSGDKNQDTAADIKKEPDIDESQRRDEEKEFLNSSRGFEEIGYSVGK